MAASRRPPVRPTEKVVELAPVNATEKLAPDYRRVLNNRNGRLFPKRTEQPKRSPYELYLKPPPGVLPKGQVPLAFDEFSPEVYSWANGAGIAPFAEGIWFLGYPILSEMAQRPEYRMMAQTIAEDMTRKWIELQGDSGEGKKKLSKVKKEARDKKIAKLGEAIKRYELPHTFFEACVQDSFFGRAHIYIDLEKPSGGGSATDDREELKTSIGDGRNQISREKCPKGALRRFGTAEAVWVYPTSYNSDDPLKPTWYKPDTWFVMGKEVHSTRLLTMISNEVPDLLKPAYIFGGLPLIQMAKPYVDNWLRTRQSVSDITHSFSVFGLKTNLNALLMNNGDQLLARGEIFNNCRDNGNMLMIDKDTEDFFIATASLASLDKLQAQAQEHMSSVVRIPLVKLLGIQPAGLNACLVGDTLIETDQGYIPIMDVRPGHKVMTRNGWAPVAKAGCTGYTAELVEITVDGTVLRCTADHRIWLSSINEFVPASNVRPGHLLLHHGEIKKTLNTEGQSSIGEDSGGILATAIMRQGHLTAHLCYSIGKFGAFITDLSRQAITFITRTGIERTISSTILSYLRHPTTPVITALQTAFSSIKNPNMSASAVTAARCLFYPFRREPCFAAIGVASQIDEKIENRKPSRDRCAFAACAASLMRLREKTRNIVRESALPRAKIESRTWRNSTENIPKNGDYRAVSSVRRVPASEYVYDIQVSSGYLPEFFANGICVHNSSEGEIRVYYDTIKARQESLFRIPLTRCIDFIQLSEFGDIDEGISFEFANLWELDEAAEAAVQAQKAATHAVYVNDVAAVSAEEVRRSLASDPRSPYQGLDLDEGEAPGMQDPMLEGGKAPLDNSLSNRMERKAEEFGSPETGGFSGDIGLLDAAE